MSRKLFAFLLSELSTARVICKHDGCGVVTEMPITQLAIKFGANSANQVNCPHCRNTLTDRVLPHGPPFLLLAAIAAEAKQPAAKFDIEFVLPDASA